MVMYKKNDICLEMKHAFIVKLIMLFNLTYFLLTFNAVFIIIIIIIVVSSRFF